MVQAVTASSKQAFSILKVPVSREKQVLYYYRPYVPRDESDDLPSIASPPPPERTLYVVHFLQQIEESFLLRTF